MNLFQYYLEQVLINVTWMKPSLDEEMDEFERTSKELNINKEQLIESFKDGELITLTDDIWRELKNTDSWKTKTMEDVKRLAIEYGKNLDSIINAKKLPAPIILKINNKFYLIAGNTRLMYSRANKINPLVYLIEI